MTLVGDAHTIVDYDGAIISAALRIDYHNEVLNRFSTDDSEILVQPTADIVF